MPTLIFTHSSLLQKRKEEAFRAKLAAAEKDLAAAREHARIKSLAPAMRGDLHFFASCLPPFLAQRCLSYVGQNAAHEMQCEIYLPGADSARQLILPGQITVSMVKNAVWSSFAAELSGT